ncbi:OmpA family protein [Marinobacter pelagius]|uniref:Outer membrane protein OmpA n=1 Tax=Marinobacter pelagius TaxID=379482 RepID=A0A1I4XH92_9GAMM|nr:OmpA family protein [Marinobacter pelagius]SFN24649.1 Outer membrane protein OmpA [Marinobacter pelagius]
MSKPSTRFSGRFILNVLLTVLVFGAPWATARDDAKTLYENSLTANDADLRGYYRKKLADQYPNTAHGLFARGWLANGNGDVQAAHDFYRRSVEAGDIATAYNNLGVVDEDADESDKDRYRKLAMEYAIKHDDPVENFVVHEYYSNLHSRMDSQSEKQLLYSQLGQSKRESVRIAGMQIRVQELESQGRYQEALNVIQEEDPYSTSNDLLDLELKLINKIGQQQRSDAGSIIKAMLNKRSYLHQGYAENNPILEYYYKRVYDYTRKLVKDPAFQVKLLRMAFEVRQSPGLIDELYSPMSVVDIHGFKADLDILLEQYPDYGPLYSYLGLYYKNGVKDSARAFAANEKAIEFAYSDKTKADNISWAVGDAIHFGMMDEAEALLEREANGLQQESAYRARMRVALLNQQFGEARKLIASAQKHQIDIDKDDVWLTQLGEANEETLRQNAQQNPFLTNWDKEFGGSLSLAIEFPVNSAEIPTGAYRALDKAASALKRRGGERYIFRVEGHTDPSGGNKINIPLSQRRAESVKRYLIERHDIDAGRLQAIGMGDIQPVATNYTEEGRKRNRRVDIRPYGNISEPQLVTRGYLDTTSAEFSTDGRFVATGQMPITLWDTRYGVRLRELYMGGNERRFSPNNRYLAVVSDATDVRGTRAKAIYVTDIKTGNFKAIIPLYEEGGGIAWSPDGRQLAYTDVKGVLSVFDLEKQKLVMATPMSNKRIIGRVVWTKDGRYVVVGQAQRKQIDIFDALTLEKARSVDGVDWPHAMGLSDDGRVLLVSNNNRTLTLYDTEKWALIDNVPLKSPIAENIYPIPGTTKVVMDDKFDDQGVAVFDYKTRTWDFASRTDEKSRLGATPDGDGLWVASDHRVQLIKRSDLKVISGFVSAAEPARKGLDWDESDDLLFAQDEAGVNVWHVSQARLVQRVEEETIRWVKDSRDGKRWWTFAKNGELLSFSTRDYAVQRYKGVGFRPNMVIQRGHWLVVSEDVESEGATSARVATFDLRKPGKQSEFSVDLITASLRRGNAVAYSGISTMAINGDSDTLALSTWWNDLFEVTHSKNIQRFRLSDGAPVGKDVLSPSPIRGLTYNGVDSGDIKVSALSQSFILDLNTGRHRDVTPKGWRTVELENGKKVEFGSFILEYNGQRRVVKDSIYDVVADSKRNVLIAQSKSNVLTYYSLDTLEPRLFVHFKKNGEWLAADNRGYFTSSLNGTSNTYWSLGDNFLPFEALREKYENSRFVKESLAALFNGEAPIDPEPIIEPDVLDFPFDIAVTSETSTSTKDETYKLRIKITKQDKSVPDPTVHYLVNGRKSRGFDSDPFADMDESLTFVRTIPLSVGENTIEAIVQYKGVDVAKKVVAITREEDRQKQIGNNTLWYFGVGVSEYANAMQNLDFADRDALELEKAFKAQKGRLFEDVRTKVLVNGDATARDIKIQLYDFLSQAQPEDNVVIFIAGHGVQDSNQTLYYMPHDGELKRPFTGMAMDDFKNFLDQRPINQKALFLMDICHAGAFDNTDNGRVTSEDVIKKLSYGTATTVFSSSTGAQQSLEDERFGGGHGAFTYAILQAIEGAADKQAGDENGFVSLMEMIFFTKKEVASLTNKAQQPTVPVMSGFQDYSISASN